MIHRMTIPLVAALIALISAVGCGYPELSPKAYECAKALYSICNRHDAERLDAFEEVIRTAKEGDELTENELGWLHQIVADARAEKWDDAAAAARQMMSDQIERS